MCNKSSPGKTAVKQSTRNEKLERELRLEKSLQLVTRGCVSYLGVSIESLNFYQQLGRSHF